jgi:hypothetical protein
MFATYTQQLKNGVSVVRIVAISGQQLGKHVPLAMGMNAEID